MPTQFGTKATSSSIFGEGYGGSGTNGIINIKTLTLIGTTAKTIETIKRGNRKITIECQTDGGPNLSLNISKNTATDTPVISAVHADPAATGDKLIIEWATNDDLKVKLSDTNYSGSSFKIMYY